MAFQQIDIESDTAPAVFDKINANFGRMSLAGTGAPALAADYVGQEYADLASGAVYLAKSLGSADPLQDWEPKVRTGDSRLSDARAPLPHAHPVAEIGGLQAALDGKQDASLKGRPNGYAGLDADARIPAVQLPAGVVTSAFGRSGAVMAAYGDYVADQIAETSSCKVMTAAERTKLAGVAAGATANASDAALLARANHTGTQPSATISDLAEAVDDRVAALIVAGANVTKTYNDAAGTLTIASAGGAYLSQRVVTASGGVTAADRQGLVRVRGDNVTLTLAKAGLANLEWIEIRNENVDNGGAARIVTVAAGADGINAAGTASVQLAPGDTLRLAKVADVAPVWLTLSPIGFLTLAANQYAAIGADGAAQEARTDRRSDTADLVNPSDGARGGFRAAWPGRLEAVHAKTRGGAATLVVRRNGTAVAGFGSPVALSAAEATVASGTDFAAGDYVTYHLAGTTGLVADGNGIKGVYVTSVAVRTGG